ncbi:MAG: zincin-like metallopeptidase domain-containing protein, partial [Chloroflexota bacterium]|nr:zincin-like metallopeptidase domain-containing protein [Chloroflexota bacterium]
SQFASQSAYTHTALHELGHATGHPDRLNRPTLVKHGGFGSEAYAREELRAEIAAMMTGERLGIGHEPRHGTAYVASWIKALENDPKEIRAPAVDAQRISDWLITRERERIQSDDKAQPDRRNDGTSQTIERDPDRPPTEPAPARLSQPRPSAPPRNADRPTPVFKPGTEITDRGATSGPSR